MPDDRGEIEAVVRQVIERLGRAEFAPDLWTGPLAKTEAVWAQVDDHAGWKRRYFPADIKKLRVLSIEGDEAHVDVDAFVHTTATHPVHGESRRSHRLTGPVVLHREAGAWRVETLKSGGVDLKSTLFRPAPAETRVQDVRIAAFAQLWRKHRQVTVLFQNEGSSDVVVERVVVMSPIWWLFEDGSFVRQAPIALVPGASWGREVVVRSRWRHAPLHVKAFVGGRGVELRLDEPLRVSFLQRVTSNRESTLLVIFALAGLARWAFGFGRGTFAIALFLAGAWLLLLAGVALLRGPVLSAQPLYLAAGLVGVVIGILLLRDHGVTLTTLALVAVGLGLAFVPQIRGVLHERQAETSGAT